MHERRLTVERTARYFLLGEPGAEVRRAWFVLHGYGQLAASLLRRCEPLAAPGTLVVAPEALSRFYVPPVTLTNHENARVGASWMTREDRDAEIADYVGYLDRVHLELTRECGAQPETRVLGFSQGVATAVRWALLGKTDPPRQLLLWAGHLPPETWTDAARTRLAGTELVLAAGDSDPYVPAGELARTAERARGFGYRVRELGFAGGHVIPPEALTQVSNE